MGNAATCRACGLGKASDSTVSDRDLNQRTDYYRTVGSASDDGSLVSSETWLISCRI